METGSKKNIRAKHLILLTASGALVFWIASFVTSILPIAAEYRAAYDNWSMRTVWIGAVFAGLLFGFLVSYILLKSDNKRPLLRAVLLSLCALVIATLLIDLPHARQAHEKVLHYFLIGVMFNTIRFVLLGLAIGLAYRLFRVDRSRASRSQINPEIQGTNPN
jgi:MFS family permease